MCARGGGGGRAGVVVRCTRCTRCTTVLSQAEWKPWGLGGEEERGLYTGPRYELALEAGRAWVCKRNRGVNEGR